MKHERLLPAEMLDAHCPTRRLLDSVMNRWAPLLLTLLAKRSMRYNELQRELEGISHKMLTQTLRALESEGLISRTAHPVVPPHVDYALTADGRQFVELLSGIFQWIQVYQASREVALVQHVSEMPEWQTP